MTSSPLSSPSSSTTSSSMYIVNMHELLDKYLKEDSFDMALALITDENHFYDLRDQCMECIQCVLNFIKDDTIVKNPNMLNGYEHLLKIIVRKCSAEECIFVLRGALESNRNDAFFTTILKLLQICHLKQTDTKWKTFEWSLDLIVEKMSELELDDNYNMVMLGKDDILILEDKPEITRIITRYLSLSYYLKPIWKSLVPNFEFNEDWTAWEGIVAADSDVLRSSTDTVGFMECEQITRKFILIKFLIQILGSEIAKLDLERDYNDIKPFSHTRRSRSRPSVKKDDGAAEEKKVKAKKLTNTYTMECVTQIMEYLNALLPNPYYLLHYLDCMPEVVAVNVNANFISDGNLPQNIKLFQKIPLESMGIYYYLLLAEQHKSKCIPLIYDHMFIFEKCVHLMIAIFESKQILLHSKGIFLGLKLLENLRNNQQTFSIKDIESSRPLRILHEKFQFSLINLTTNSQIKRNAGQSLDLLKQYIFNFNENDSFIIIRRLFNIIEHDGLYGTVITCYKEIFVKLFQNYWREFQELPELYTGNNFKYMLLTYICKLSKNVETDCLENESKISSALNFILYLAIVDLKNLTKFYQCLPEIKKQFLQPLSKAIEISRAHYELSLNNITNNKQVHDNRSKDLPPQINLMVSNACPNAMSSGECDSVMLQSALARFDLLKHLLAKVEYRTNRIEKSYLKFKRFKKNN